MARLIIETPFIKEVVECETVADELERRGYPAWDFHAGDRRIEGDELLEAAFDPCAEIVAVETPMAALPAVYWVYAAIFVAAAAYTVIQLNKIPSYSSESVTSTTTSTNKIGNRQNDPVEIGGRVPELWGFEPALYPQLMATQKRFNDNGVETEVSYLRVGRGEYHINDNDVKDGKTAVKNVSGMTAQFYKPGVSPYRKIDLGASDPNANFTPYMIIGTEIEKSLAPKILIPSSEVDGVTLAAPNAATTGITLVMYPTGEMNITDAASGETLADMYSVSDTITISQCYAWVAATYIDENDNEMDYWRRFSVEGDYVVTAINAGTGSITVTPSANWAYFPSGGQAQATVAKSSIQDGTPDGVMYQPGFPNGSGGTTYYAISGWVPERINYYSPSGASTGTTLIGPYSLPECDAVSLNIVASSGLYKRGTGDPISINVIVEIVIEWDGGSSTESVTISTNKINKQDQTGVTYDYALPSRMPCTVTAQRTSPTDKTFSGTVVDEIQLRDLWAVREVPEDYYPPDVTTILLSSRANSKAARIKERKLNFPAVRDIGGDFDSDQLFINVIPAMHADEYNGRRDVADIDTETLALIDAQIQSGITAGTYPDGARQVGYYFDGDDLSYEDQLKTLCSACNLIPVSVGGTISFIWDYLRDVSVLLTHDDIMPGSFSIERSFTTNREYDGVELNYKSADDGETYTIQKGTLLKANSIDLQAQHNEAVADYIADIYNSRQKYLRIAVELDTGLFGRRLAVGMRCHVENCTRRTYVGGSVMARSGLVLTLSDPVPDGIDAIWLDKRNGDAYKVNATKTGDYEVTIESGTILPEDPYTDWQENKTSYVIWKTGDNSAQPLDLVVTEIESQTGNRFTVTFNNYDERIYAWPPS